MSEIVPHCQYYVVRKKRFCRMTVKENNKYCGEHEPCTKTEDRTDTNLRIICPLDNKHTCYANKLEKHLKVCNAKRGENLPYINEGINLNKDLENPLNTFVEETCERNLSNVPIEKIKNVIKKVNHIYEECVADVIKERILEHELLLSELSKPEFGKSSKKHLLQNSSLLQHLKENKLLENETCFIEFGAGRGQLGYWVMKATKHSNIKSKLVLVDRASPRHKLDNKLREEKSEDQIIRVRADISHLDLSKVEQVYKSQRVVAITKHLCGVATDLSLLAVNKLNIICKNVSGVIMAFCCHHRCLWRHYVGKEFLQNKNISGEEFDVMCGLVSWATCGTGMSRKRREEIVNNHCDIDSLNKHDDLDLDRTQREEIGKRCKHVIDFGRMEFLRKHEFECSLYYYIQSDITLENVCILAIKK